VRKISPPPNLIALPAKFTLGARQNFGAEMARNETKQRYLAVSNGNQEWGKKGL
jgi:hypothetical protein